MGIPQKNPQPKPIPEWQLELKSIEAAHNGVLRPADVVKYAENEKTALHGHFIWDDAKAGYQYRLEQARDLIQVVVTIDLGTRKEFRTYVSLVDDRNKQGGGYRSMVSVMSDKQKRKRLLAEALAEFDRWKSRYESLEELAAIFKARGKISGV